MDTDYPVYEQPSTTQQYLPSDDGQSLAPVPDMIAISQGVPGMNPYGMLPETRWGQWWSPGDSAFTESANATALNLLGQEQHFSHSDSILDQENPAQWGSPSTIFSQILPSPSTETTSPNSSPEHSQRRRGSSATQSDQRRQKRNPATVAKPRAKPTATKSTRRVSTAKTKANPTATAASEKPKRGRKVKALTEPSPPRRSKQKDEDDEDEYEEAEADPEQEYEQHSKKVQERNRIASNKFRIKKRDDAKQLRIDEQIVEQANRELNDCVSDLTMQVYDLKMRLLQHTECDCTLIKEYIATEAQRYIKDLGEGKHANSTPALAPQPDYQHAYHEHHPQ